MTAQKLDEIFNAAPHIFLSFDRSQFQAVPTGELAKMRIAPRLFLAAVYADMPGIDMPVLEKELLTMGAAVALDGRLLATGDEKHTQRLAEFLGYRIEGGKLGHLAAFKWLPNAVVTGLADKAKAALPATFWKERPQELSRGLSQETVQGLPSSKLVFVLGNLSDNQRDSVTLKQQLKLGWNVLSWRDFGKIRNHAPQLNGGWATLYAGHMARQLANLVRS